MKRLIILFAITLYCLTATAQQAATFTDTRDGKVYKIVTIGSRTWLAENLAFKADSGCWAYDNNGRYTGIWGCLYTFRTAQKACPAGWHLPGIEEWDSLISAAGGADSAGSKLKAKNWWYENGKGTDAYGFNALPGGFHSHLGDFDGMYGTGYWWSATATEATKATVTHMYYQSDKVSKINALKTDGYSVRCIKD